MSSEQLLEVKDRVQKILTQIGTIGVDADGDFFVSHGSTTVFISVFQADETRVMVAIQAPVALEVPPSPDLYHWVATSTDDWTFGHLVVQERESHVQIVMRHTLFGNTIDPAELNQAVILMALSADEVDDQITGRFGGHTFLSQG